MIDAFPASKRETQMKDTTPVHGQTLSVVNGHGNKKGEENIIMKGDNRRGLHWIQPDRFCIIIMNHM
jgi:hypothetical protein